MKFPTYHQHPSPPPQLDVCAKGDARKMENQKQAKKMDLQGIEPWTTPTLSNQGRDAKGVLYH
jgi:hypothetical protein